MLNSTRGLSGTYSSGFTHLGIWNRFYKTGFMPQFLLWDGQHFRHPKDPSSLGCFVGARLGGVVIPGVSVGGDRTCPLQKRDGQGGEQPVVWVRSRWRVFQ